MTPKSIFKKILFIGPNYINHKGGIGAVLMVYQKCVPDFNFIATYDGNFSIIRNILLFVKSYISMILILLSNNIKIIHIHGASKGSFWRKYFIFLIGKYLFRKKIVYHIHGGKFHLFYKDSNNLTKKCINHFINNSDHIICLSKSWKSFFISSFNVRSISIVNNPIEIPNLPLLEGFTKTYLSLLFLGKVGDNKGIFDLLSVLDKKHSQYKGKLKLKIGGDGEIDRLKAYIDSKHLHDIVEYVGWVSNDLKNNLLSECDILILPSYNEGLPISILEAMSYGKAIISTPVGGIPEVVKNVKNGFLIEPGNIIALEECIDWVLENTEKLPEMGLVSSKLIQDYDIKKVMSKLSELYIKILK